MVKKNFAAVIPAAKDRLFLAEGHAVSALVLGGICLVGAHQNALQGAEVCFVTVICALMNSAFNALVCFAIH